MAGVPAHANKSWPMAPMADAKEGLPKMMMSVRASEPSGGRKAEAGERAKVKGAKAEAGETKGRDAAMCGDRGTERDRDEQPRKENRSTEKASSSALHPTRAHVRAHRYQTARPGAPPPVDQTLPRRLSRSALRARDQRCFLWEGGGGTYALRRSRLPKHRGSAYVPEQIGRERGGLTGSGPADKGELFERLDRREEEDGDGGDGDEDGGARPVEGDGVQGDALRAEGAGGDRA